MEREEDPTFYTLYVHLPSDSYLLTKFHIDFLDSHVICEEGEVVRVEPCIHTIV